MPLTWRANTLYMRWCIDCHKHPERYVRRREDVFKADYNRLKTSSPWGDNW